jgi:hypothetical protein
MFENIVYFHGLSFPPTPKLCLRCRIFILDHDIPAQSSFEHARIVTSFNVIAMNIRKDVDCRIYQRTNFVFICKTWKTYYSCANDITDFVYYRICKLHHHCSIPVCLPGFIPLSNSSGLWQCSLDCMSTSYLGGPSSNTTEVHVDKAALGKL